MAHKERQVQLVLREIPERPALKEPQALRDLREFKEPLVQQVHKELLEILV
jgi:hypothetical protein